MSIYKYSYTDDNGIYSKITVYKHMHHVYGRVYRIVFIQESDTDEGKKHFKDLGTNFLKLNKKIRENDNYKSIIMLVYTESNPKPEELFIYK